MSQKVIAFAGKKQSGKSSAANFLAGYILSQQKRANDWMPLPSTFSIDDDGKLVIDTVFVDSEGVSQNGLGVLDLRNKDLKFVEFAEKFIWPHVKIYSFADSLKEICGRLFGLTMEQLYGTDEQKNSPTKLRWKDMARMVDNRHLKIIRAQNRMNSCLTAREVLQFFGTNICRGLYDDCWIEDTFKRILAEGYPFVIIDDCRFGNEVSGVKSVLRGKVIKFTKELDEKDEHDSETGLLGLDADHFSAVINNFHMSIQEKNQAILDYVYGLGWLNEYIGLRDN